jgi:LL-diaminopimelate aminotransferase
MIRINENYLRLESSYLFSTISKKVAEYQETHPGAKEEIIRLGIGDVTRALPHACVSAFKQAAAEMGDDATFRGYGPEQGYEFLREKIASEDYRALSAEITADEVFVSDGAKCDTANIQELFSNDITIGIPDPVYPVYVDTNVMAGRSGNWNKKKGRYDGFFYLDSTEQNDFVPLIPKEKLDLIYLCFPNNPTGATITMARLEAWVEYARKHKALILYDAAYEAFIRDSDIPHSIYEIDGAREVAIEFRSFSKTAGFTGTRCAFTVVPKTCMAYDSSGKKQSLHTMWNRRHTTKFNGVSYPVQRAAEAVYSNEGKKQTRKINDYYLKNAKTIREKFISLGYNSTGGINSPYIWINVKEDSWRFFDRLLDSARVVCTPGSGFGRCGEGYIRISAFNSYEKVLEALERIDKVLR